MLEAKTHLEFEFDSKKEAEAVYRALNLEAPSAHSDRAKASLALSGKNLGLKIDASDAVSLLAYLRRISIALARPEDSRTTSRYALARPTEVFHGKIVPTA